jgi:hypothetical protein
MPDSEQPRDCLQRLTASIKWGLQLSETRAEQQLVGCSKSIDGHRVGFAERHVEELVGIRLGGQGGEQHRVAQQAQPAIAHGQRLLHRLQDRALVVLRRVDPENSWIPRIGQGARSLGQIRAGLPAPPERSRLITRQDHRSSLPPAPVESETSVHQASSVATIRDAFDLPSRGEIDESVPDG